MGTYYQQVDQFINRIDPAGAIVEIGLDRGEGSTKFFSNLAKARNVKFYGIDADHNQVERARAGLSSTGNIMLNGNGSVTVEIGDLPQHIVLAHAKGEDFLHTFSENYPNEKISLAYLDNFDWDYWVNREPESFVAAAKQHYLDYMKVEMNNINSGITHLIQAIRLLPLMTEKSIIVCDDTWFHPDEGVFIGKCMAAIPYLMCNGYRLIHNEGYRQNSGVILGRGV